MEKAEQHYESSPWTWKDTLDRIRYIDTIISQIVLGAIPINAGLFTAFGALNILLHSEGLTYETKILFRWAMFFVSVGGLTINFTLAINLCRQEYIRQWYFRIFPSNLPLKPHEDWLNKDIPNDYNISPKQEDIIKKADKRLLFCKLGKKGPGFCISWIIILFVMGLVFSFFAVITWYL